ncbi:MAG: futalosine hydrolase [Draconibacterium sp.]|nr:MAG: futalosine hydrolase [Draconibacterium sp.]
MKILIVAATWMEVKLLVDEMEYIDEKSHFLKQFRLGDTIIDILVSGIGVVFTTFHLANALRDDSYRLVLNIGIAGSLTRDLAIGELVNIVSEEFADLGIEKEEEFLTLFETGFLDANEFPFENGLLKATESDGLITFKKVRGITTNKSYSRKSSVADLKGKFNAQVESMEGAAVFYVCKWLGVPCFQIRAISNYVETRHSAEWNIPLALDNLKKNILDALKSLSVLVK